MNSPENPPSLVSHEQAYKFLEGQLGKWDFDANPEKINYWLAINAAVWVLEFMGQADHKGRHTIVPDDYHRYDGFDGEELPESLKPLVMREYMDEVFFDECFVLMSEEVDYFEVPTEIPGWYEMEAMDIPFHERIEKIKSDPKLLSGVKRASFENVIPRAMLRFEGVDYAWGIDGVIDQNDIRFYPFGKTGTTRVPYEFITKNLASHVERTRVAVGLTLLAAKYATKPRRPVIPIRAFESFEKRLRGEEQLPTLKID